MDLPTVILSLLGSGALTALTTAVFADRAAGKAFERNQQGIKAKLAIDRRQTQAETVDAINGHVIRLVTWVQQRPGMLPGLATTTFVDEVRDVLVKPPNAQDTDLGRLGDTVEGQHIVTAYNECIRLVAKGNVTRDLQEAAAFVHEAIDQWRAEAY